MRSPSPASPRAVPAAPSVNRWLVLAVLFVTRTAMGCQYQSVAAVAPPLAEDLGLSFAAVGLLHGLYFLTGLAIAIPGGLLGDRFGAERMLLASLAVMALGGLLTGLAPGFGLAWLGRLLAGCGGVTLNVLLIATVIKRFEGRELATALGVLFMSWPLGIAVASAGLSALADVAGWRAAVHLTTALAALCLLLLAAVVGAPPAPAAPGRRRLRLDLSAREAALLGLASGLWALYNGAFILVPSYAPPLLIASGLSLAEAGRLASLGMWVGALSLPFGGWLTDRCGRPLAVIAGASLAMAVLIALLTAAPRAAALHLLFGLAVGLPAGAIASLPGRVLRDDNRATGIGIFATGSYIGLTFLPPIAGEMLDRTGDPTLPLYFAAAISAATAALVLPFRAVRGRPAPASPR
ncbi:MAG TPA: MFS transporter [Geminicoccaceae bacterium]|nr:MFS transporter [Geminicoccaceae bacterium]